MNLNVYLHVFQVTLCEVKLKVSQYSLVNHTSSQRVEQNTIFIESSDKYCCSLIVNGFQLNAYASVHTGCSSALSCLE